MLIKNGRQWNKNEVRDRRLHFDLPGQERRKGRVRCGGRYYPLQDHTRASRGHADTKNRAFANLANEARASFTHYADVKVDPNTAYTVQVYLSRINHGPHRVDHEMLAAVANVPPIIRKRANKPKTTNSKLGHYGFQKKVNAAVHRDAEALLSPWDYSVLILKSHPQVSAQDQEAAEIVDSFLTLDDPAMYAFATDVSTAVSAGTAYAEVQEVDGAGNKQYYETDAFGNTVGDPIMHYEISDDLCAAAQPSIRSLLEQIANNASLKGKMWDVKQTQTTTPQLVEMVSEQRLTVRDSSPGHGVSIDPRSILNLGSVVTAVLRNSFYSSQSLYVKLYDKSGQVITKADPEWYETSKKQYVTTMNAISSTLGYSRPTDPFNLNFSCPENTDYAHLLCGSIGSSAWDGDVDMAGSLTTVVFQYAIPLLFYLAGVDLSDTAWISKLLEQKATLMPLLHAAVDLVGGKLTDPSALTNVTSILTTMSTSIISLLTKTAALPVSKQLTSLIPEDIINKQLPLIGIGLKLMRDSVKLNQLNQSSIQVIPSPATTVVYLSRSIGVVVIVKPDSKTGLWPVAATHWKMLLQYEASPRPAKSFIAGSDFSITSRAKPVVYFFDQIASGGRVKASLVCYSNSSICGTFESEFVNAVEPFFSQNLIIQGEATTDKFLPLDSSTQYLYQEKVGYNSVEKHVWKPLGIFSPMPKALIDSLSLSPSGNKIGSLVGMTVNSDSQIGYAWQACDQEVPPSSAQVYTFQNISGLENPESTLKFVNEGYTISAPQLAYDRYSSNTAYAVVPIQQPPGSFGVFKVDLSSTEKTFTIDESQAYGVFAEVNILERIYFHPQGYMVAINRYQNKLLVLKLAQKPTTPDNAPVANSYGGKGDRQGLFFDPAAASITPEGEILVVEAQTKRIQAISTNGYPVPKFKGNERFSITLPSPSLISNITGYYVSAEVRTTFFHNRVPLTQRWSIIDALGTNYSIVGPKDSIVGPYVVYNRSKALFTLYTSKDWLNELCQPTISDSLKREFSLNRIYLSDAARIVDSVSIQNASNGQLILVDPVETESYQLDVSTDSLSVFSYEPFLYLSLLANDTILDIATDDAGFIYLLYYVEEGKSLDNYRLDVYTPLGEYILTTPDTSQNPDAKGIPASKIVVDKVRNVFALNFEVVLGPMKRTEPDVSLYTAVSGM